MDFEDEFFPAKEKDESFLLKIDEDLDYAFAQSLQDYYENESKSSTSAHSASASMASKKPLGIIDQQWETIDPNPDIRSLFIQFNEKFFYGKLNSVEVKWSPRMTLCAGVCSYEGRGGLCSIRLSEPLLKLRPRKDLVETLLHEMIHAYLFVTANNKDRDGHGPEFLSHMHRINKETGTNISVFHSFHDEVDVHRTHWWKCNGPCMKNRPFYGLVKRAMNRAPGPNDTWWAQHQATCGGTFTKIKEPENYKKRQPKRKKESNNKGPSPHQNIKRFFTPQSSQSVEVKSSTSSFGNTVRSIFEKEENVKEICVNSTPSHSSDFKVQPVPFSGQGKLLGSLDSSQPKSWLYDLHQERARARGLSRKPSQEKSDGSKRPIENTSKTSSGSIENSMRQSSIANFLKPPEKQQDDDSDCSVIESATRVSCPVCQKRFQETVINEHLDKCLIL